MTDEERAVWERRCMRFQETLAGNPPPSLEARLAYLEDDASEQRTAILKLDRDTRGLRAALWIVSGFVYLGLLWRVFL